MGQRRSRRQSYGPRGSAVRTDGSMSPELSTNKAGRDIGGASRARLASTSLASRGSGPAGRLSSDGLAMTRRTWQSASQTGDENDYLWRFAPATMEIAMATATTQSTAAQNGGHHRVFDTNRVRCCHASL